MNRCPYFHFLMQNADAQQPKISYPGRKLHVYNNQFDRRMLEGFTTDLPMIVRHFRHEVEMCRGAVDAHLAADYPNGMRDHFMTLFAAHGMQAQLRRSLDHLMASKELTFY